MTLIFLGDVMLGRFVDHQIAIHEDIINYLHNADIRICNLEGVITSNSPSIEQVKSSPMKYICRHGISENQAKLLNDMRIELCNLANNHILDYGFNGVKDTIQFLNSNNVKWFGFGKNYQVACKPRIINLTINQNEDIGKIQKKIKIGFFGLSDHFVEWKALETSPGINYFDINNFTENSDGNPNRSLWENIDNIYELIKQVHKKCNLIVFSIHWGDNFQDSVKKTFQQFAHRLIDHGVDFIHGHSAHHVGGIELYQSRIIIYSCGEFLNDYDILEKYLNRYQESLGSEYVIYNSNLGFIYKLYLKIVGEDVMLNELELYPIEIKKGTVLCCGDENIQTLFQKMKIACKSLGTNIDERNRRLYIEILENST